MCCCRKHYNKNIQVFFSLPFPQAQTQLKKQLSKAPRLVLKNNSFKRKIFYKNFWKKKCYKNINVQVPFGLPKD